MSEEESRSTHEEEKEEEEEEEWTLEEDKAAPTPPRSTKVGRGAAAVVAAPNTHVPNPRPPTNENNDKNSEDNDANSEDNDANSEDGDASDGKTPAAAKRGRGRPPKAVKQDDINDVDYDEEVIHTKTRGRPKKKGKQVATQRGDELICELSREFYRLGWFNGTGGGITIKQKDMIYVAPSGVQKERLQPDDIFAIDEDGEMIAKPHYKKVLKLSQCTPIFLLAYKMRGAGAVIHNHSINAVLATLNFPGDTFTITHLEMIKGIQHASEERAMRYDEELVIPIIENTPLEADLVDSMSEAMELYPDTCAVLVRRHGVYVWGPTWQQAKTMAESYDYLFQIANEMKKMGLDPSKPPKETPTANKQTSTTNTQQTPTETNEQQTPTPPEQTGKTKQTKEEEKEEEEEEEEEMESMEEIEEAVNGN
ncbi:hypothetical protein Pmani_033730 [Petrolisthes manimaculis]|uniref:Probable methylthioribulose-1-phosphate dehydratase n=1 Tax=Petrolisthes manimaculis TaxID=1843537 RepID=A0AAE1TSE7_9EUCA|nr:hypothetical protein Pmani_033730 [Petrolisthes manimaculis]